jgi:gliding motility-associated-like protein
MELYIIKPTNLTKMEHINPVSDLSLILFSDSSRISNPRNRTGETMKPGTPGWLKTITIPAIMVLFFCLTISSSFGQKVSKATGQLNALTTWTDLIPGTGTITITAGSISGTNSGAGSISAGDVLFDSSNGFIGIVATTPTANSFTLQNLALRTAAASTFSKQGTADAVAAPVAGDYLVIRSGNTVTVSAPFTTGGTIVNNGTIVPTAALTFSAGSAYIHYRDGGAIPSATWTATSGCLVIGVTATSPTGFNQNFGNLTFICPLLTTPVVSVLTAAMTVQGNLAVSGASATNTMTINPAGFNLTVNGTSTINAFGILNDNNDAGLNRFDGLVTVNANGQFINSANPVYEYRGGIANNGTFAKTGTGSITFSTNASQTITGTAPVSLSGDLFITTPASLLVSTDINFSGTTFQITSTTADPFKATAGTFSFNGGVQSVSNIAGTGLITYYNLSADGTLTKTINKNFVVTNNLVISNLVALGLGNFATTANVLGNMTIDGTLDFGTLNPKILNLSGDLINVTGTIIMNSDAGRAHQLNLGGASNAISTFTTAGALSTVSYNRAGDQQVFASANYQSLTMAGSGVKSLQGNATVSNILTLNSVLRLGSSVLTLTNSASNAIQGTFGPTAMIETDGTGGVVRNAATPLPVVFPVGTGVYYSPVSISAISGGTTGTIKVLAVHDVSAASNFVQKYWDVSTSVGGKTISATFNYDPAEISNSPSNIWYKPITGNWLVPAGTASFGGNSFTISGTTNMTTTSTYWTAAASVTFYSYQTGDWNTPNTWTSDPSGTLQIGNSVPGLNDKVVILSGRTVSLAEDITSDGLDITIDAGAFLNLVINRFTSTLAALRGQGTLQLASVNFPTTTINTLINPGGGTTEYYNASSFVLPAFQTVYNNLTINSNTAIATQLSDLTLNGNLYVKSGTFRINDNAATAKLNLAISGNVTVDELASISVGTGVTNPAIGGVTSGGIAPFINYYTYFHTVTIKGDFTNNGTVRFTNLPYPVYNAFPPVVNGATSGGATVYFQGETDNIITCNGVTDFYNLVLDKGIDRTFKLTVYSTAYKNFRLFGANSLTSETAGSNANLRKALWIRTGTLLLEGSVIIPSLSEGITAGSPNSDYFIPSNGALQINGIDAIVLTTSDDYREVNTAYQVSGPDNTAMGISVGSGSAIEVYGKLQISDGYLSTRESAGIITSNVGSGQIIIDGGTIDSKQILSTAGSAAQYTQTDGLLILRGRFLRTPVDYSTIPGLKDVTIATLNTARAANGINSAFGTFNLENTTNIFTMSGGTIRIYDVSGIAAGEQKAFDVKSSPANINVTGGTIEILPVTGSVPATDGDYLVNSTAPLGNLLVSRLSGTKSVLLSTNPLTVLKNLTLASGVLNCSNLDLSVGGNFTISAGTSYITGTNTTLLNGKLDQLFTVDLAAPLSLNKFTIDKPAGKSLEFAGSQKTITVNDNFRLILGNLKDNGNTINVLKDVFNSGVHSGSGKLSLTGIVPQQISGDGSFGNVDLNNTSASAAPVSLASNMTINGILSFSTDKLFNISTYNLKMNSDASITSSNGLFTSRYIQTAGNSGDGGLTKVYAAPGSFSYPVGVVNYTPASISLNGVPVSYGSITIIPVNFAHPNVTVPGRSLTYFWRTKSSGFDLGTATITHAYTYSQSNVVTSADVTEDGYVAARFDIPTNSWAKGTVADVDEINNIIGEPGGGSFLENTGLIDGDYTAGDDTPLSPFGVPSIYYSRINGTGAGSGLWSDPATWSTDPVLKHTGSPSSTVPGASDIVIIGARDSVYLATANIVRNTDPRSCASLQIEKGSAMDVGFNPGSNFGMVLNHPNGNGNFRVTTSYTTESTYEFPSGDFSDFNVNLGTTELYSTNTDYGTTYWLPNGVLTYGNLILSPLGGSNIIFPNHDLTIYGNLVTRGQNTDSWFCPTWDVIYPTTPSAVIAKTITVKGDLLIQGGSLIWVGNMNLPENVIVSGDVVVGTFSGIGTWGGQALNQQLSIGGSLINNSNGLLNPPAYQIIAQCDFTIIPVTFFGPDNATISNTGGNPSIIFSKLTVNKGTSQATTLTIDMAGTITTPVDNWLTLQNGTLKYARSNPGTDFTISTLTPFTIPATAGLSVDLPSNTGNRNILIGNSANGNGDLLLGGKLTLVNGNVYIGAVSGTNVTDNDIEYTGSGASAIDIKGGKLMVNGQIRRPSATTNGVLSYTQSGGNVFVNGNNFLPGKAKLEVLNLGSSFNMSGGNLTIVRGGGTTYGDLFLRPATSIVTGGTIIFTPVPAGEAVVDAAQAYHLDANITLNNIVITGKTAATARDAVVSLMVSPLSLDGSLTLSNINSFFNSNNLNVSLKGDLINNGTYNYGTNLTTFNGGFQSIKGTSVTNFNDLTIAPVNSVTAEGSFTVFGDLTVASGNFVIGANKITLLGDLDNEGSCTDTNAGSGISLSGTTTQQQITGSGAFGRIELNNGFGARANSDINLQGDLAMTLGILDIGKYQLTLSPKSYITGAPFSVAKMIKSDGVISGLGLVKFFTAEPQIFVFPVGVTGKYTPASFNILASDEVGSIGVNPINNRHSSITDPSNALNYYWQIRSSGITGFYGDIQLQYLAGDVVGTESDYVAAKLALPGSYWYKAPPGAATDNVNESTHKILFTNTGVSNLTGDYTAGNPSAIPEEVPAYATIKDGNWSDKTVWIPIGSSPPCPDGGPNGANVIINNVITTDINNIYSLGTTINNKLIVDPANYSHNLGVVDGDGKIYLTGGNLPGGNYEAFTDCSGNGTIEYGGTGSYTIIESLYNTVPNIFFTGTGTRILPNKELTVCKRLVIDGPVLDNSVNKSRLIILGTMERYNTGGFLSGSGNSPASTVTFAGTIPQEIGGATGDFSGANKLNNLEINNAAGLSIGTNGLIELNGQLLLTDGIIHTTAANKLVMLSTSPTSVIPTGGIEDSYVDGPLVKNIINGGSFTFPVGNGIMKGHDFTVTSTAGSTMAWTVECFIPNPTAKLLVLPLKASNTQEFWSVSTPLAASGKIKIAWDPLSVLTPLMVPNGLDDMRVAQFISGAWNELPSSATGDLDNGVVFTTSGISISGTPSQFTIACVTIPEARASFASPKPVCGTTGIPITFTSFMPINLDYTLDYTIDGVAQPTIIVTSPAYTLPTLVPGAYKLTGFAYNNGTHPGVVDRRVVNVYALPAVSDAGLDRSLCGLSGLFLAGNSPAPYQGIWTKVSGPGGTFIDNTKNNTYFTGILGKSYNLRWTIYNVTCKSSDDVIVSFPVEAAMPSGFMSAPAQVCAGITGYVYTVPAVGGNTYTWSYTGTGHTINGSGNSVTIDFDLAATSGVLSVTASNGCGISAPRTVSITVNPLPVADAGTDRTVCAGTPTTIGAPAVAGSTYDWISVPAGFSSTQANPDVSPAVTTTYTVTETNSASLCSKSNSVVVTVTSSSTAVIAYAGSPFCSTDSNSQHVNITGTGTYFGGNFTSDPGLSINALTGDINPSLSTPGTYLVTYTIPPSGSCPGSFTTTSVTITAVPQSTIASSPLNYCNVLVSGALGGNTPSSGTGLWSQVSGPGTTTFSDPASESSTATVTLAGTYVYEWSITLGACPPSTSQVTVNFYPVASVTDLSLSFCGTLTSASLGGNAPEPGTGTWSQVSGPGTTTFSDASSGTSTATATAFGTYVYQWTISGGGCAPVSAQVSVNFNPATTDASVAVNPLEYCATLITGTLGGNTPVAGTGLWTQVSGPGTTVFSNPASENSTASASLYGSYIYKWTITTGDCDPGSALLNVNYYDTPTPASVNSPSLTYCGTLVSASLGGNTPVIGSGLWSQVSGPGTTIFSSPSAETSTATASVYGTYVYQWTISSGTCTPGSAQVTVIFTAAPTTSVIASSPLNICGSLTSGDLGGSTPVDGTGSWSQVSGPGTTSFSDPASGSSTATATVWGAYVYQWTITNGTCTPSSSQVTVNYSQIPTTSVISNPTLDYCGTLVSGSLGGNTPVTGAGIWIQISGPGTTVFTDPALGSSAATASLSGTYVYEWRITNGICPPSATQVTVSFNASPDIATVSGTSLDYCSTLVSGSLGGNTPVSGTGIWTQVSGPGTTTFSAAASGSSTATADAYGTYIYEWTISSGTCSSSSAQVTVSYSEAPTTAVIAASPLSFCGILVSDPLGGNVPATGTGSWSIVGGGTGTFSSPSDGNSIFTGDAYASYFLRWTISNGSCTPSTADINVILGETTTVANAGTDQTGTEMCGATSATLAANAPLAGTGLWSIILGTGGVIADPANPVSSFSGVPGILYTLRWTISNTYCTPSIDEVDIKFYESPTATISKTDILCNGQSTGSIDLTVSGGTTPYSFAWTGTGAVTTAEDQAGLNAGVYGVTVTDANSCEIMVSSIDITEPEALTGAIVSQTNASIFGNNDGSVTVSATGGVPPYLYNIDGGAYQSADEFGTLTAGHYTITVQDNNLCTNTIDVNITQPDVSLIANVDSKSDAACFGTASGSVTISGSGGVTPYMYKLGSGTYQASGTFTGLAAGTYVITVLDAVFSATDISIDISQPDDAVTVSVVSVTDVLCFGSSTGSATVTGAGGIAPYEYKIGSGSFQTSDTFTSLTAGEFTVTIQDANLCTSTVDVTINEPALGLSGSVTAQTDAACYGSSDGTVTVAGSGGTEPYSYSIDATNYQVDGVFTGLSAGSYTITVRDASLCTLTVPATVGQPDEISISHEEQPVTCPGDNDGSITLAITGGTPPYTVIWSDGVTTPSRTEVLQGTYNVVVSDKNGCAGSAVSEVGVVGTENCLEVQEIITPNNDLVNDTWKIKNIDLFPKAEVFVYNRWGELVFTTKNLLADPWDGTSKGRLLSTDSYHYVLYLHNGSKPKSGVISIIR